MNEILKKSITWIGKNIGWAAFIAFALTVFGAYVNDQLWKQSTTTRVEAVAKSNDLNSKALFGDDGRSGMAAQLNATSVKVDFIYMKLGGK